MDQQSRTVVKTNGDRSRNVPSVVRPLQLSGRTDSPHSIRRRDRWQRAETGSEFQATASPSPEAPAFDQKRVDNAAAWISAKVAATIKRGAEEVGEYILDNFFQGDHQLVKSRDPSKNASFRALADKCGTPDLPISKTWLNNAVGVAMMIRCLPQTAKSFRQLPPSFQETLLPLADPTKIEEAAKKAAAGEMSYRQLRRLVASERAREPKSPTIPSSGAIILTAIKRSTRILALDGAIPSFTKIDLDAKQRQEALDRADDLIRTLQDLVVRLRRT